jgi:hypothetical protein
MGIRFSQFAGALTMGWLVSGANSALAQAAEYAAPDAVVAAPDASFRNEKKPVLSVHLTDARNPFTASLWAAHILEGSPRGPIIPGDIEGGSEFRVTGPLLERSVGIQLEFDF